MRVAINLLSENPKHPSGAMQFWQHIIKDMSDMLEQDEEFVLYVSRLSKGYFNNLKKTSVRFRIFPWSNERRILRVLSEYLLVPIFSLKEKIDVLNTGIVTFLTPGRLVIHIKTMHAYTTPKELPWLTRVYRKLSYPRSVRAADAVIVNSESLLKEVEKYIPESKGKLRLVYEAVDHELFNPDHNENEISRILAQYNITNPYVLFVSSLWRYKNCDGLLRAWLHARNRLGKRKLVIVGFRRDKDYARELDMLVEELGIGEDVNFCGGVTHEETAAFYQGADLFVYPSFNETFGLTILEAMACGCPVVTSNTSAMPEISGGAALLAEPDDYTDIAEKMVQGLDMNTGSKLVKKGLERASEFSWKSTAKQTLSIYREVYRKQKGSD